MKKLKKLFDYQTFENLPSLTLLIEETETRINSGAFEIPDEDLDIWAAGDILADLQKREVQDD